jgi:hypothetical protein
MGIGTRPWGGVNGIDWFTRGNEARPKYLDITTRVYRPAVHDYGESYLSIREDSVKM